MDGQVCFGFFAKCRRGLWVISDLGSEAFYLPSPWSDLGHGSRRRLGTKRTPVFVGFNAPFDWSFVNYYFHRFLGGNPFGFAGLDIKAFYMGKYGTRWGDTKSSKIATALNVPEEGDHNALHDAIYQAHRTCFHLLHRNRLLGCHFIIHSDDAPGVDLLTSAARSCRSVAVGPNSLGASFLDVSFQGILGRFVKGNETAFAKL